MFDFKNSSPTDLKKKYDEIAKEMNDEQFFTKKELNHLPEILGDGEQVLAFSSGLMDGNTWLITLTDRRVIFLDKGMIYGLKQISIDLDKINAVAGEVGLIQGTITIEDGGLNRKIKNVWKKTVIPFTNKTRDAISNYKNKNIHNPGIQAPNTVDQLMKLAQLRDQGILTNEEFEEQKRKLLS